MDRARREFLSDGIPTHLPASFLWLHPKAAWSHDACRTVECSGSSGVVFVNYTEVLAKYKRMRSVGLELNNALLKLVPRKAIEIAGRKLGLWQDGVLVFDIEEHSCVLMDYAIHDCFQDGRNAVERYLVRQPPGAGTDTQAVLEGMRRAFFSIFRVEKVVSGVGAHVLDILGDRRYFLADVGIGGSAYEALTLVSRVLPFEDFIMTSGAALPADEEAVASIAEYLNSMDNSPLDGEAMTREEMADLNASLIRFCLKSEGRRNMRYGKVDDERPGKIIPFPGTRQVGRNDPCPCGSGKKYKKCCGQ